MEGQLLIHWSHETSSSFNEPVIMPVIYMYSVGCYYTWSCSSGLLQDEQEETGESSGPAASDCAAVHVPAASDGNAEESTVSAPAPKVAVLLNITKEPYTEVKVCRTFVALLPHVSVYHPTTLKTPLLVFLSAECKCVACTGAPHCH
jgi:hypothetical protein